MTHTVALASRHGQLEAVLRGRQVRGVLDADVKLQLDFIDWSSELKTKADEQARAQTTSSAVQKELC